MSDKDSQDEISVWKEKNNKLVQQLQEWKMLAAQRENEKLELMKELNEMRLKLSLLRSNGNILASKLDATLQSASERALEHIVIASGEIARSIDLAKTYMRERAELEADSPRWSGIGGTPNVKTEKVHRVPPMMFGGQSIQPVVSLSRTPLNISNTSNTRPVSRSPNQTRSEGRPVPMPMHMLQEVYIPLTRIDADELVNNQMETEPEGNNDSIDDIELDNSGERDAEESQRISEDEDYNSSRRLDDVMEEDMEPEDEVESPQRAVRPDNPLEGPSWLLDPPSSNSKSNTPLSRRNLEPDSTTEVEETTPSRNLVFSSSAPESTPCTVRLSYEFSPTVRRRKRTPTAPSHAPSPAAPSHPPSPAAPSPAAPSPTAHSPTVPSPAPSPGARRGSLYSPRPTLARRNSQGGRVLKVMVAKMRLDSLPSSSPLKRQATLSLLDAPSPNGATVSGVIVSESTEELREEGEADVGHVTRRPAHARRRARRTSASETHDSRADESERDAQDRTRQQDSRCGSCDSRSSDSGGGGDRREPRTRRPRKVVSYQEKPLNRKMRR